MTLSRILFSFLLVATLVIALSQPSQAADCLDSARIETEIVPHFNFLSHDGRKLDPDKDIKPDLCNKKSVLNAALRAFLFIKDLGHLGSSRSDFDLGFIGDSPYEFFASRVENVVIETRPKNSDCPDQRLAFVHPVTRLDKKIWICPAIVRFDPLTISSVLVHEARHLDGPEHEHRPCTRGPLTGKHSCDRAYSDGGSYAVGAEYQVKLSRSEEVSPAMRAFARAGALTDFLQRFTYLPFDLKEGALLRDSQNALSFFDGEKEISTGLHTKAHTVLSLQAGLPMFFEPLDGSVQTYEFHTQFGKPVPDILTEHFSKRMSAGDQKEVIDVVYGDEYACVLMKTALECYGKDLALFRKSLASLEPLRFVFTYKSRLIQSRVVHLITKDGYLYRLPTTSQELQERDPKDWPRSSNLFNKTAIQPWGRGTEIGLTIDGKVLLYKQKSRQWELIPALESRQIRDVIAPFVWSTQLNEL